MLGLAAQSFGADLADVTSGLSAHLNKQQTTARIERKTMKTRRKQALTPLTTLILALSLSVTSACRQQHAVETTSHGQQPSETEMKVRQLQEKIIAGPADPLPDWAIGPFRQGAVDGREMAFRQVLNWKDPAGLADWKPRAFWNPALLEVDGRLYMLYRTGPTMEGLNSRIALAWSDDGGIRWQDYERNPIIYPTESYEARGVEDPRIYKHNDRYYLFYTAVQDREGGGLYADISLATSADLLHWEKQGRVMPRSVSKGWAKSAVIPRSPAGEAVSIDDEFLMYVSERPLASDKDVEEQMIGRSKDLVHWEFEQEAFLEPNETITSIHEVATITTGFPDSDDMIADVFYVQPNGDWGCGQVRYNRKNPTRALAFTNYGVCSWGGKIIYRGQWLYAQGWLEPEVIRLYTAPLHRSLPR